VDMNDGRNPVAPLRAHRFRYQHEGGVFLAFEDLLCPLGKNDRREWTERLPVLYPAVQNILHVGLARIGQQAAIAERAWTKLRSALKPADHALLGQQFRGVAAYIVAARRGGLNPDEEFSRRGLDVPLGVELADTGLRHDE